ncbi:hypothetical protein C8R45DRAFT_950769 [Mycena sanguinolenta]|nr:hypothetical protein C8R45DRAFT_950769 [Mycena sanguinolenta]
MFSYFSRKRRTPDTTPRVPPQLMNKFLAVQEDQINVYRKRLGQIHQAEKRNKERVLRGEDPDDEEQRLSVDRGSVSEGPDSVWELLDVFAGDIGNISISPPPSSANSDSVPESPVFKEWLNEVYSEETLNDDDLHPVELPPSPRPETPLTVESFMDWLRREEEMEKENSSLVVAALNRDSVPESPVSAVHSIQNNQSMHNLFPNISPATLTKIVEHELKPMDLARLNPRRRWDKFKDGCSLSDYPSLHSLLVPICVYFSVLQAGVSVTSGDVEATRIIGDSGLRYVAHLIELEELYQWPAVVQYHMQFHHKRRQDMVFDDYSRWRVADIELINRLLVGRLRRTRKQERWERF